MTPLNPTGQYSLIKAQSNNYRNKRLLPKLGNRHMCRKTLILWLFVLIVLHWPDIKPKETFGCIRLYAKMAIFLLNTANMTLTLALGFRLTTIISPQVNTESQKPLKLYTKHFPVRSRGANLTGRRSCSLTCVRSQVSDLEMNHTISHSFCLAVLSVWLPSLSVHIYASPVVLHRSSSCVFQATVCVCVLKAGYWSVLSKPRGRHTAHRLS